MSTVSDTSSRPYSRLLRSPSPKQSSFSTSRNLVGSAPTVSAPIAIPTQDAALLFNPVIGKEVADESPSALGSNSTPLGAHLSNPEGIESQGKKREVLKVVGLLGLSILALSVGGYFAYSSL